MRYSYLLLFLLFSSLSVSYSQNIVPLKDCKADFTWMSNGLTIMFHDASTVTQGGPINSWFWTFGDGTTSTQQHPTKTYTIAGTYSVKLTIGTVGGCNDSQTYSVTTCQLTLTTTNGICTAAGQVPVAVNVTNQLSSAGNISFNLDGTALVGNYPITPQAPVNQTINIVGDGLSHTLIASSNTVVGCTATKTFTVADCGSNCFLGSLNITPSGGVTKTVTVNDNFFSPIQTTIVLGDIVRFQWNQGGHTSTSDATTGVDSWNSGNQNAGFIYNVNIKNPGLHRYYCQPHGGPNGAGMAGSIVANCPPNNLVPITIAFNTTQANAAGYLLFIDNVQQGAAKQYSGIGANSLTYNLPGDGQIHTIKIQDVTTSTCAVSKTYQTPNCGAAPQCQLSATASTPSACNAQSQVSVNLTVNAINGGASGFNVLVNNTAIAGSPFTYNPSGATTVNNVLLNGNGLSQNIVIQDVINANCNTTVSVTTPNCNLPCSISNFTATSGNSATHIIEVKDFEFVPKFKTITLGDIVKFQWTGAVAHTSQSDTPTGANTWNSGLLNSGATYNVSLTANGVYPYYCAPHGAPNGVGMAGSITVVPNCNNGNVAVNLSFNVTNPGASGYNIKVDGVLYAGSPFQYALTGNTLNTVNIIGNGQSHTIEIQDVAKTTCLANTQIITANCNFTPPCSLTLTTGAVSQCNNTTVSVPLTIVSQNAGTQYNIKIDGTLYAGSPFTFNTSGTTQQTININGDGNAHNIEIQSVATTTCLSAKNVTVPNCSLPTLLSNFSANTGAGIKHNIEVKDFEFLPKNKTITLGDTLKWTWTGAVAHTVTSDATTGANSFDSGLKSTGFVYQFKPTALGDVPYYCAPHGAVGGIGMAGKITILPNCNNGKVAVNLKFDVTNGGAQGYDVFVDNVKINTTAYSYSINTNNLTINIIGDGNTHQIAIKDKMNPTILVATSISTTNCNFVPPCNLALQLAQAGNCSPQNKVPYHIMVTPQNAGNQGFNIKIDNVLLAGSPFAYNGSTMVMMMIDLPGDGQSHMVLVEDKATATCKATQNVTTPNCTVPCSISNLILSNNTNSIIHTVEVQDFKFFPKEITVNKGDVVKFVWTGQVAHTATSDETTGANSFDSGLVGNGATYSVTMTAAGTVPYYCKPHGAVGGVGMAGKITVIEPCNNNQVSVNVKFNQNSGSQNGYKVLIDNVLFSQNNLYNAQNPTSVNVNIAGDGQAHTVKIEDMATANCSVSGTITTPNCNANPPVCNLDLQQVTLDTCIGNQVKITLKVKNSNTATSQGFTIFLNNSKINNTPFAYAANGITTVSFNTQGNGNQAIIEIRDAISTICKDTANVILPNCTPINVPCLIENLSLSTAPTTHVVEVRDFDYFPKNIDVVQGDTVKFVWTGQVKHTATSNNFSPNGAQGWNSGLLGNGSTYKIVMTMLGANGYYCIPHGGPNGIGQSGVINVLPLCDAAENVKVKVKFTVTKGAAQGYKIYVDGQLISPNPFIYNNLQGQNQALVSIKGDGKPHTVTIQDFVTNFCAATEFITTPTCNAPCAITNLKVTPSKNEKITVLVKDFEFEPKLLACHVGDTILFDFVGQIPHTVTSDKLSGTGSFDSGTLSQGAKYQVVISNQGTHKYYCKPHGGPNGIGMAGEIMAHALCENGKVHANIEFDANGSHSGFYNIFIDNKKENQTPLSMTNGKNMKSVFIIGDGKNHNIKIEDNQNTNCNASASAKTENCGNAVTCNIDLKINQLGTCDENKKVPYNLEITCEDLGKTFDVLIDGIVIAGSPFPCPTNGNSMTIPVKINGDGKAHFIKVQSITNLQCSEMKAVTTPKCTDNCSITNLKITNIGFYQRHKVEVKDFEFSPKNINVTVGDTIDFIFTGQIPHTVTSDSTAGFFIFDSGTLSQGAVYQLFVKAKGDFGYYCKPHGAANGIGMAGKIFAKNICDNGSVPVSVYFEGGSQNQTFKASLDNKIITPSAVAYNALGKNKFTFNVLTDSLLHSIKIFDSNDTTCAASLQFYSPDCADPCTIVQPNFTYVVENDKKVIFTNTTFGNANKWLWGFGEGGTSSLKNPTYQYKNTGTFDVCLLAHATLTQCLAEPICKTISVQLVDSEDIVVEDNIVIYPNPTSGVVYLTQAGFKTLPAFENPVCVITLYNSLGQVLFQQNSIPESIDLQGFASGIYFLKIGNRVWRVVKD